MLLRLVDLLKSRGVTTLFTDLVGTHLRAGEAEAGVSSLMDTWISLRRVETEDAARYVLSVIKARGMRHSSRLREYSITNVGVTLGDPRSPVSPIA